MRTVITGGCGFIGSALTRRLLKNLSKSDEIIIVDTMQRHGKCADLTLLSNTSVKMIEADLCDVNSFRSIPAPVDRLYHFAAIVGVDLVESNPVQVMRNNTLSTLYLLDWFTKNKTPNARVLFSSSSEVYSGTEMVGLDLPIPTPETVPLAISDIKNPRVSYALTKMWGEAYATYLAEKNNVFAISVRYHNIFGPMMGYNHVIPQVILRILSKEKPFRVIAAEQTRSFCWVGDAAKATNLVMESENIDPGSVVHIGNENGEIKISEIYDLLFDISGWSPERKINFPAPQGSVSRRCPDTTKLQLLTGYIPDTPLRQGLEKTVAWYTENPR